MQAHHFTFLFISLIILDFAIHTWLNIRQIRAISKHASAVPAEFAEQISLKSHQRAARYSLERLRLSQLQLFYDVVILLALTILGGLHWLYQAFGLAAEPTIFKSILFILCVQLILSVLGLPFAIYKTFRLEQKYGFNRTTPGLFIKDTLMSSALSLVLGSAILWAILYLMQSTEQWWFWAWLVVLVFMAVMMYIAPTWLMPLFNKFTPLDEGEVKDKIESLANRCDFQLSGLFVMDSSKRSSHGNAFFTGFGSNRRIVFFDTLLNKLGANEIEAIMAHELGHFKHKHIIKRLAWMVIGSFIFFALLGYVSDKSWFYEGLCVPLGEQQHDHALSLVLFALVIPSFTFWLTPLNSRLSRRDEFEADAFAAQHSDANALIAALVKLYDDNASTLTPDPIFSAYYDSHPPAIIRIQHLKRLMGAAA
ncbi:heat shock protein HtpX [Oligella urethralis]|uniref:M48 family metallopeptidase n=1 Tax=Oligella urethralis TaxID=90245 RepID=UPI000DF92B10|nr:M48 family metallopeptidase [Oligella urethralis]SUA94725.1 heat shock protein HtpX [Oligella urethralis]